MKVLQQNVNELHSGDQILFQATIEGLGDSQHLHHLHCFGVKKVPGNKHIDIHVASGGRYKLSHNEAHNLE